MTKKFVCGVLLFLIMIIACACTMPDIPNPLEKNKVRTVTAINNTGIAANKFTLYTGNGREVEVSKEGPGKDYTFDISKGEGKDYDTFSIKMVDRDGNEYEVNNVEVESKGNTDIPVTNDDLTKKKRKWPFGN